MREIFRKYLDNNCSPAEVRRLLDYFNIEENEVLLRRLITEWLEENEEEEEDNQWKYNFYRALALINRQLSIEAVKLIGIFREKDFRVAAKSSSIYLPVVFTRVQYSSIKNH